MSKRSDKQSKTPTATQNTSQPANEIIHGRLTELDWNNVLELEAGTDFILNIVEELSNGVLTIIHDNYLQSQVVPYVLDNIKEDIMKVVEWQYLTRDDGEDRPEFNETWLEDEEPMPALIDSWAQGSVPSKQPIVESPAPTDISTSVTEISDEESEIVPPSAPSDDLTHSVVNVISGLNCIETETSTPKQKKKLKVKRYRGKVPVWKTIEPKPGVDLLQGEDEVVKDKGSNVIDSKPAILKVQQGRPPGTKDVTYDEKGNVIQVVKFGVDSLPTHRIRTKYKIIDPSYELEAAARMKALRMGRVGRIRKDTHQIKQLSRTGAMTAKLAVDSIVNARVAKERARELDLDKERSQSPLEPDKLGLQSNERVENITALPLSLVDTMELAPGVVVKEGDRVKRGPRQVFRTANMSAGSQHSIRNAVDFKQDFVIRTTPVIKPINSTPPLHSVGAPSTLEK